MSRHLSGFIQGRTPVVVANLSSRGSLVLGRGPLRLVIDTGFTGDFALPAAHLRRMDLQFIGTTEYLLADGSHRPFRQWMGRVESSRRIHDAVFMEGDGLVGMEFLMTRFRDLRMDHDRGRIRMTFRRG